MPPRSRRHRGTGFPLVRTFVIVVALHVSVGGGLLWIAKTESGQAFAKTYNIKLFEPPKPPEAKLEETPPPPPPPKVETPDVPPPPAAAAVAAAPAAPMPTIGGSGGSTWSSGKFVGDSLVNGPDGAFHAGIMSHFRKHYREPSDSFGSAELELGVTKSGAVSSYRLVRSSGNAANDQAILNAAREVKDEGVSPPPDGKGRIVTVRFIPTS